MIVDALTRLGIAMLDGVGVAFGTIGALGLVRILIYDLKGIEMRASPILSAIMLGIGVAWMLLAHSLWTVNACLPYR